jgi:hypothetical protein
MIHLESFSKFREEKLRPLTDKYGKSGYLSVSTTKKLKDLGIELEHFKALEKRVIDCTKMVEADNTYLLDMLLLDLDDFLEKKGFGAERWDFNEEQGLPVVPPTLKVDIGRNSLYRSGTFEMHIKENPVETLFEIIKMTNKTRVDLVKKTIDDRESGDTSWYYRQGARDYGNLTNFKRQNQLKNLKINPVFRLRLKIDWGDLDEQRAWDSLADGHITIDDVDRMKRERWKVMDEIKKFLEEDTYYRYFHLIGFKNLKFRIIQDSFALPVTSFKIEVEL